jgi:DNA-binding transcriptional LysR family regulator
MTMRESSGTLTIKSLTAIVAAAVCGAGICYVPIHHVAAQIGSEQLVRLLGDYSPNFDGHCFYYPPASTIRHLGIRHEHSARSSIICETAAWRRRRQVRPGRRQRLEWCAIWNKNANSYTLEIMM